MAIYKFKTLKEAKTFITRAQSKGYFTSKPKKNKGRVGYWVSVLNKRGGNIILRKI